MLGEQLVDLSDARPASERSAMESVFAFASAFGIAYESVSESESAPAQ